MQQGQLRNGKLMRYVNFEDGTRLNLCRTTGKGSDKRTHCVMHDRQNRYFDSYENALLAFNIALSNRRHKGIREQGHVM